LGSEYGHDKKVIQKWENDIGIFVQGENKIYLIMELKTIFFELNNLLTDIKIHLETEKDRANLWLFIGHEKEYLASLPPGKRKLAKPILREEITQALGLMQDSAHFPGSIFFSGPSHVTAYTRRDRIL
jgi:hypothetical protein